MLLILLVALGLVVSCSSERSDVAFGEVVLYTSMPDSVIDRLKGVVENRFPDLDGNYWLSGHSGISLTVVSGRTADIQGRIAEEIATGGVRADVIWLAEPSPYETYKDMGVLAPYEPPADAPIPSRYIDPDGFYVAGRVICMVLAWNTDLRSEALDDWLDLHQAEAAAFPAPQSGAARATIKALTEKYGLKFFQVFRDGGGESVASNGAARDGVADGTFEAVAVLDYMARRAKADGLPLDFAYPVSGTVVIPSPLAITADARNPGAAKVFVDYILSRPGQEIVVQLGSFYPVRLDVAPPPGAPMIDTINAFYIDWEALAVESGAIADSWAAIYGPPVESR
jgi:iron(III) transport system substrate-binding protein